MEAPKKTKSTSKSKKAEEPENEDEEEEKPAPRKKAPASAPAKKKAAKVASYPPLSKMKKVLGKTILEKSTRKLNCRTI